ncbi:MAG TPA: peptide ABC transporter substrate-binding protein [Candidatus Dormibacteraeota bacterium]|nr:peptide ABC transporter substrate-binding protein [Candidatus Dormibacteraeota bacterium]
MDPTLTFGPLLWRRALHLLVAAGSVSVIVAGSAVGAPGDVRAARQDARIVVTGARTFDPAAAGDSGSAEVDAQLFETLTAFDSALTLRPALASAWQVLDGGRRVRFTLRDGLAFSDGAALTARDVVRSWLRVIDPAHPSPLASLLDEVAGAREYRTGALNAASVGLSAPDDRTVEVRLARPQADFPAIVSGPSFGVVPANVSGWDDPTGLAVSGGYRVTAVTATEITLAANDRYWAGRPAIPTLHLVTSLGGTSTVDAFSAGDVDYTPIDPFDAAWIEYDKALGPQLRSIAPMSVTYFGFDTNRPPFDDVRVRRAFAAAVDWRRLATLASSGDRRPATGIVPPGVPGRSDRDFLPAHDPTAAKAALAAAGYPDGHGFPAVTLLTDGSDYAAAMVRDLRAVLGVDVGVETMDSDTYFTRLRSDPPAFWSLAWVADYPGANDFLGLLLGSGATANYGGWRSPEFDAAIGDALAATDPASATAAYDRAQALVQRDAPIVPVDYAQAWALSKPGLLGAGENGLSIMRMAGLAWGD